MIFFHLLSQLTRLQFIDDKIQPFIIKIIFTIYDKYSYKYKELYLLYIQEINIEKKISCYIINLK